MKTRKASRGLLILGMLLIVAGVLLPYALPEGMLWDDERATELTNASEALHDTMHEHGHAHSHDAFGETDPGDHPEIVAASQRYRKAQADLDAAKFWTNSAPAYLRWSGLIVCVAGVATYFASRSE